MRMNDFWSFVKWYFDYIGEKCFDDSPPVIHTVIKVTKKERLSIIIIAYLLMLISLLLLLTSPSYLLSIAMMIATISLLYSCQFSVIYYFLIYVRYKNRDISINDRIIVDECILFDPTSDIRKIISRYFRIVDVRGSIWTLTFLLARKTQKLNKRIKLSPKDIVTLKFRPNAILFDNRKIYTGKLFDSSDLAHILCEVHTAYNTKV